MAQTNTDSLTTFFLRVTAGLVDDAAAKGQKIPVSSLRHESDEFGGVYFAADYFKYLIDNFGRGPGKFPPPDKMTAWVEANPDVLARAKQVYKYLTAQSLGFLIGRKIANEGTDIYSGKKEGIDLLGVMEKNMPELLTSLGRNELHKVATQLQSAVKQNTKVTT